MRTVRGKALNLTTISKFFDSQSNLSQRCYVSGSEFPFLLRLRLFSTVDGNSGGGRYKRSDFDEFNNRFSDDVDGDDKFSGKNRRNLSAHRNDSSSYCGSGRPLRGERQMPQFQRQNNNQDRNFRRQGSNFNDQFGGGRSRGRANMKSNDDSFNSDGNDEGRGSVGLGGDVEVKGGSRPSIRELLNRPVNGEKGIGQEGNDFLERFKLGGERKEEKPKDDAKSMDPPQEEKMEPTEDAEAIFKKMKQTGLIPNAVAMLDGLCKDGLVQEAMKLFGVMREKGAMPEVVVYTAVVEGFCKAQKLDDAKRVFRKMQDNGIVPNAFSYTVLIKGLCRGKRLEDAVDFCVEMLEAGHSPNVITFTGLVLEFCKEKGVEEARNMISTLKQKGFYLDEKAVKNYLDKTGPTSPMVREAIFGPKKSTHIPF